MGCGASAVAPPTPKPAEDNNDDESGKDNSVKDETQAAADHTDNNSERVEEDQGAAVDADEEAPAGNQTEDHMAVVEQELAAAQRSPRTNAVPTQALHSAVVADMDDLDALLSATQDVQDDATHAFPHQDVGPSMSHVPNLHPSAHGVGTLDMHHPPEENANPNLLSPRDAVRANTPSPRSDKGSSRPRSSGGTSVRGATARSGTSPPATTWLDDPHPMSPSPVSPGPGSHNNSGMRPLTPEVLLPAPRLAGSRDEWVSPLKGFDNDKFRAAQQKTTGTPVLSTALAGASLPASMSLPDDTIGAQFDHIDDNLPPAAVDNRVAQLDTTDVKAGPGLSEQAADDIKLTTEDDEAFMDAILDDL